MPKKSMEILTESMFYLLMAFCTAPMCGTAAADFIEKRSGSRLKLGPATLYTSIGKFEKEKYIVETAVDGRRRTYTITERGRAAYANELWRLKQCLKDAEEDNSER